MKKRIFFFCLLACAVIGTATECQIKPTTEQPPKAIVAPQVRPVSEVIVVGRDNTPPTETEPLVGDKSAEICTLPTGMKPTEPKPNTTQYSR